MITIIIVLLLFILGVLAVLVVISASILDDYDRKCPKCGSRAYYLGVFGNYVYYRCSECNHIIKESVKLKENEQHKNS